MSDYQPSHNLVMKTPGWGNPEHNQMVLAVFEAGATYADEARFRIDRELLQQEDPALVEHIDAVFESPQNSDETMHRCQDLDAALEVLEALMNHQTAYAVWAAQWLTLTSDGKEIVAYGPDHDSITVSENSAPGIVESIAEAIEQYPAVLVPDHPLAEWEYNGRRYSIGKMLCVGRSGVFTSSQQCSALPDRIKPDEESLTIELSWESGDRNTFDRIVDLVAKATRTHRPHQLRFDSKADFEAAHEALEKILQGLRGARGIV